MRLQLGEHGHSGLCHTPHAGQTEEERKEEKGQGEQREKERAAEEEGDKEVKKDVTDWVEVRKRTRRKNRKMIQIFVKVDGGKTSTMEIEMSDKVDPKSATENQGAAKVQN